MGNDVVRSALCRFPLVTDHGESVELANTRLCVVGSNETWSDLFYVATRHGLPPWRSCSFLNQVTNSLVVLCTRLVGFSTWLVDLVVSLADQVSND